MLMHSAVFVGQLCALAGQLRALVVFAGQLRALAVVVAAVEQSVFVALAAGLAVVLVDDAYAYAAWQRVVASTVGVVVDKAGVAVVTVAAVVSYVVGAACVVELVVADTVHVGIAEVVADAADADTELVSVEFVETAVGLVDSPVVSERTQFDAAGVAAWSVGTVVAVETDDPVQRPPLQQLCWLSSMFEQKTQSV